MSFNAGIVSSREATVPSGNLAKASSVGANTVNGPSPANTESSSAACNAATSVVNLPSSTAISTMVLLTSSATSSTTTVASTAISCSTIVSCSTISSVAASSLQATKMEPRIAKIPTITRALAFR